MEIRSTRKRTDLTFPVLNFGTGHGFRTDSRTGRKAGSYRIQLHCRHISRCGMGNGQYPAMACHPDLQEGEKGDQPRDRRDESGFRAVRTCSTGQRAAVTRKTMLHLLANLLFATILFGALFGGPIVMLILLSERLAL